MRLIRDAAVRYLDTTNYLQASLLPESGVAASGTDR